MGNLWIEVGIAFVGSDRVLVMAKSAWCVLLRPADVNAFLYVFSGEFCEVRLDG